MKYSVNKEIIKNALKQCDLIDFAGALTDDSLADYLKTQDLEKVKKFSLLLYGTKLRDRIAKLDIIRAASSEKIALKIKDEFEITERIAVNAEELQKKEINEEVLKRISEVTTCVSAIPLLDYIKSGTPLVNNEEINFITSAQYGIYKDIDLIPYEKTTEENSYDGIWVKLNREVYTDFFMIVKKSGSSSENEDVIMYGKLYYDKNDDRHYLVSDRKSIDFSKIVESNLYIVVFGKWLECRYEHKIEINVKNELPVDEERVLCIDFGTCNTVAGTYSKDPSHKPELVKYLYGGSLECIYPTAVYIKDVKSNDDGFNSLDCLFGFDARNKLDVEGYAVNGSIFFELKRWITSLEEKEKVSVESRKLKYDIARKDIIKEYILHVIRKSESYFRCKFTKVHFTAPIQLKNKLLDFMSNYVFLDSGITVEQTELDEGIAIVYNYITRKSKELQSEKSENEKILILDCGGGTTDLARCEYYIEKNNAQYVYHVTTAAENCNSNYGGNNITYRVFQLLKVKFANHYESEKNVFDISKIFPDNDDVEIFNQIDDMIVSDDNDINYIKFYEKLNEESKRVESILPTNYNSSSSFAQSDDTNWQVRRNFHYLWNIAEKVKIEFFNHPNRMMLNFNDVNSALTVTKDKDLYFFVNRDGRLVKESGADKIEVNCNELSMMIKPEIYYILSMIFNINGEAIDFNGVTCKFTGQSCKIRLFHELMKEFIPGQQLRGAVNNKKVSDFKLDCIKGAISYVKDKATHYAKLESTKRYSRLMYKVSALRGETEIPLIDGRDFSDSVSRDGENIIRSSSNKIKLDIHPYEEGYLSFRVSNTNGKKIIYDLSSIKININNENKKTVTIEELKKDIESRSYIHECLYTESEKTLLEELTDELASISETQLIVFVVPNKAGYGFYHYEVIKEKKSNENFYYINNVEEHLFESGVSSRSFFSGNLN